MKLTKSFVETVKRLIVSARTTVARGVDLVQVQTNFEIGRLIVEHEQKGKGRAEYGQEVVKALAERLTAEFGRGFSARNLAYMRTFFQLYQDRAPIFQTLSGKSLADSKGKVASRPSPILQTASAKSNPPASRPFTLSWSHYVFLLGISNSDERSFYEIESTSENWTLRELKRQFDSSLYERLALSRDKQGIRKLAEKGQIVEHVNDLLKEPLVLEFLGLEERSGYSESDLETAILNHIEHFLLELGKGFLFEARQRRFTFDDEHFWVDLVFYNRLLRCYVLIDLKIGRLTHQDLGQMQMYVNYFDQEVRMPEEALTIGIVLCKRKNGAVVRITLPKDANIHAREYQLYLPSKDILQNKLIEWTAG